MPSCCALFCGVAWVFRCFVAVRALWRCVASCCVGLIGVVWRLVACYVLVRNFFRCHVVLYGCPLCFGVSCSWASFVPCLVAACCSAACCFVGLLVWRVAMSLSMSAPSRGAVHFGWHHEQGIMWYKKTRGLGWTRFCRYIARDFLAWCLHSLVLAAPNSKRFYVCLFDVCLPCISPARSVILNLSICLSPCWSRAALASCLLGRGDILAGTYLAASEHTFVSLADVRHVHAPLA